MATYFPNSSNQTDSAAAAASTYSEAPLLPGTNNTMMYINYSSSSGSFSDALAANAHHHSPCIDFSPALASDSSPSQQEVLLNFGRSRLEDHDVNRWSDDGGRNGMLLMQQQRQQQILPGRQNLHQGQGLSLSLSTQIPSGIQYQNPNQGFSSFLSSSHLISGDDNSQNKQIGDNTDYISCGFPGSNSEAMKEADFLPYGMSSIARTVPSSKYLKAAQQLLDEVVNVRKALKQHDSKKNMTNDSKEHDEETTNGTSMPSNQQDSTGNSSNELSAAEKQDLQNKMTKLLSMLDEVDRRYKQYYHQMQIVVSSFDMIAGCGAAKPYTALALQTISRHFRCLRDSINSQIGATRKSLGEQDSSANNKGVGISRLRYVDQQLRQQRALQQLGMMQQHAWRPQRGLPESSVSILRAWLFEHFLHPYPKDSDKIMLARQTGLSRSQVSNWFINARVRLWKPMVEEMYKEEIGDTELDSNSSSEIASKGTRGDMKSCENRDEDLQQTATSVATERCSSMGQLELKSAHVLDVEMVEPSHDAVFQNMIHGDGETEYRHVGKPSRVLRADVDSSGHFPDAIVQPNGEGRDKFMATAAAYHLPELGRFGSGHGVSLTLGLQHCEGGTLPMSIGNHQSFVAMRGDDVYNAAASMTPETADFDCSDSGSRQQHRFNSSHFLHDFVA